ncbi:hypothetical protein ABZP36_019173 [Zizania latifolia]
MHYFCFTIPYGFAVLTGGVLGYLRRDSTASLAGGASAGTLLILGGFVSLKAFEKRRKSYLAFALEIRGIQGGADVLTGKQLETLVNSTQIYVSTTGKCILGLNPFQRALQQICLYVAVLHSDE